MKEYLGMTGTDKITGYRGVITGVVHYITKCSQFLISPRVKGEGERISAEWFDVDRVDIDAGADKVVLNTTSSGPDVPAPTI